MNDENVETREDELDETREEQDPGYLEDAATEDKADEVEDQRKPYVHDPEVHGRDYRVEGNDVRDFVGVDPEYRTYANEYDAPILTDVERFNQTDQYDHLEGNADEEYDADVARNPDGSLYELTDEQRKILRDAGQPVDSSEETDGPVKAFDEPAKPVETSTEEPEPARTDESQPFSPTL